MLGARGVAAAAFHGDRDAVGRRHHRAGSKVKRLLGFTRVVVQAEDRVARKALEETVFEHAFRTAIDACFLGGLKNEIHGAGEVLRRRDSLRRTEQYGRVAVVAARMHDAFVRARVREPRLFGDRKRVHVGTDTDLSRADADLQPADDTGAADAFGHFVTPRLELLRDESRGLDFLVAQLRMLVDPAPQRGELAAIRLDVFCRAIGLRWFLHQRLPVA